MTVAGQANGTAAPRSQRRRWPERLSLLALDVAAFGAGFRVAHALYVRLAAGDPVFTQPLDFPAFGGLVALQVPTLVVVFFLHQLYHLPRGTSRFDLGATVFRAVAVGVVLTFALGSLLGLSPETSRWILVYDWLATFGIVIVLRLTHRAVWSAIRRAGVGRERVLIVGTGPAARELVARIERRPWLGYEVVGLVDDVRGLTRAHGVPVIGRLDELGALVDRVAPDEVLVALPDATRGQLLALVSQCQRDGLSVKVFPDVFQIIASEIQIGDLDGLPLLTMRDVALRGWRRTLKRAVDIALSAAVLVLTAPLLLLLAVLVKLESPGPAFYVQERMGLDARPFPILKLRSMRPDAEADTGAVWAKRDDPRRTRIGSFIRRWSLDELPQFVNVLLGHMSIVGPRPERPEFVDEFRRRIPRYMERHREKAGITGWAQINGLRGDTSIAERTKYDLYYIENWSLLFDFKIMLRTLLRGLRDPNAY